MQKEKINILKKEMRKITDGFDMQFISQCGECGNEHKIDYFDYFASIFITCPACGNKATFEKSIDISMFGDVPFYKSKFIDGYFKIMQQLTISGVDFSQDITEEQATYFDYSWDFASGIADIYTSFEIFLYDLLLKKLEAYIKNGEKISIDKSSSKFANSNNVQELVEKINSGKICEANLILEQIGENFSTKDCKNLLVEIRGIRKKDLKPFHSFGRIRNDIVHRGLRANFEDYAKAFISLGNILNKYSEQR